MTSGPSRISGTAFYRVTVREPACGLSAVQMRGPHDAAQLRHGQPPCMGAIEEAMAFASAMLLMVLAGLAKGRLEWRPPFWRRHHSMLCARLRDGIAHGAWPSATRPKP